MSEHVKYLLIGAGLAAHHALRGIRERDPQGRVLIVGDEPDLPYTRPHLSKTYLQGKRERAKVLVKPAEYYAEMKAEIWTGRRVTAIEPHRNEATLADGETLTFERALLATGGEPRHLSLPGADLPGIFYLRTLTDADAIRAAMPAARRAVVIGGGFIGAEVAASLTLKNIQTTVIFPEDTLLQRQVGAGADEFLTNYFKDKGVEVLVRTQIEAIQPQGTGLEVKLAGGAGVKADLVVAGIGITPRLQLAEAAGLKIDRGVVVNEYLQTSQPAIYAAGDIALYHDQRYQHTLRLEHWDNAVTMGKVAGLNLAGADQPFDHVPYFYSDLFDLDLQAWGDMYRWDTIVVRGSLGRQLTYFYLHANKLVAALAINPTKEDGAALEKLIAAVPEVKEVQRLGDLKVPYEKLGT